MFKNTFYIKAGKEHFYIRSLKSKNWIRCNSTFEIDENLRIKKITGFESSNSNVENKWTSSGTITRNPFGHPRVVVNEFEYFMPFVKTLLKELRQNVFQKPHGIIFHIDYNPIGGLSDIEIREIRLFLEHLGAKAIYIVNPEKSVSVEDVENFYGLSTKNKRQKDNIFWQ